MANDILYYGDNWPVLCNYVKDETIDLVYLDPPFKSNQDYNVLFSEQDGSRAAAQIKAFDDTWRWDIGAEIAFREIVDAGGKPSEVLRALRAFLGESDMMAYLAYMAPRLIQLHRVLKPTGSLYLHCDPTASHYLKLLMDSVFGPKNFLNEIIWHYRKWPSGKYTFQRNHDVLLFYRRSDSRARCFNQLFMERAPSTLKRFGNAKIVSGHDLHGARVPSLMEDQDSPGVRMDDVWDIGRVPPIKCLFPTQKPEKLLARIIAASSNQGDVVLDPFCGCGTTIVEAQRAKRRWIGIDITNLAITLIRHRLSTLFGKQAQYTVVGEPVSLPDAQALAAQDRYQFQWWALGLVGARPTEKKKGGDKGIDGKLFFHDEPSKTRTIILQVKSGHVAPHDVRDLRGVINREAAEMGVLITLEDVTPAMVSEAATAGFYESRSPWWKKPFPKIQLLTIKELLGGKKIEYPSADFTHATLERPSRRRRAKPG